MSTSEKVVDSDKIWACLITTDSYLPGLLTLAYSLRRVKSRYPLVALHTGSLPDETLRALAARHVPLQRVPYLCPGPPPRAVAVSDGDGKTNGDNNGNGNGNGNGTDNSNANTTTTTDSSTWYANDPRFRACFTKLAVFSLTGYTRVVLLDADMLVRQNMDELFELPLDGERRLFAATHACLCNPLHFRHYPPSWTPPHCAFTLQQQTDSCAAQTSGGPPSLGMGLLNGGLLVLHPDLTIYSEIVGYLHSDKATPATLPFADQSLLSELFRERWVALPYVYNALKTMRWAGVHGGLWRDEKVKNVHYILTPKPWEEVLEGREKEKVYQEAEEQGDETDRWWREVDLERRRWEVDRGFLSVREGKLDGR
ncbi:glycosyltransferase [Parachaetomium inaequale]|uniref:Glycosyltransferase n=1 Tax=Parachaetomium inaequale TaxID=2588326 RepID=A0AAN6P8Y1_9PEZI|nr:glycosyltransferase [Parachaetomium inaequale]